MTCATPPWRWLQLIVAPRRFTEWARKRAKERVATARRIAAAAQQASIEGDDAKAKRLLAKLMRV